MSVVTATLLCVTQDAIPGGRIARPPTALAHAVVDGPDGLEVIELPTDRADALRLKRHYSEQFWCSTRAQGCGGDLILAAGPVRIPHFRHHPGATCVLATDSAGAGRAYEHLNYQRALVAWLADQGFDATIEYDFGADGRADLFVVVRKRRHSIEVQLSAIADRTRLERDQKYRHQVDQVTWLFGPRAETAAASERAHRSYSLSLRSSAPPVDPETAVDPGPSDPSSIVEVGLVTELAEVWCSLKDCQLRPEGFWTPHLHQALADLDAAREAAANQAAEEARRAAERRLAATSAETKPGRPLPPVPPATASAWEGDHGTLGWWRHVFPDHAHWAPGAGWRWTDHLDADSRAAARTLCYVTQRLHASGKLDMLLPPDGPASTQVIDALEDAGFIRRYNRHGVERWERSSGN